MTQNLALSTRPMTFSQVVGQDSVVTSVVNQLNHVIKNPLEKIAPNLLIGIRGTGKTTIARLIAKYLNCSKPIGSKKLTEVCTCDSCQAIDNETHPDYLELDTAKNNGVAQIEEIIQAAHVPNMHAFKVIFLDECHLLSRNAANTLLKTLEEPPAHVMFVLATTEPEKLLPTISSRCRERYLLNVTPDILLQHLQEISYAHSFSSFVDNQILEYIARNSGGSVRDAVQAFCEAVDLGEGVTVEEYIESRARVNFYEVSLIIDALTSHDMAESLTLVEETLKSNAKADQLYSLLQDSINKIMLSKAGVEVEDMYKGFNISLGQCLEFGKLLTSTYSLCNGHIKANHLNLAIVEFCSTSEAEIPKVVSKPVESQNLTGIDAIMAITKQAKKDESEEKPQDTILPPPAPTKKKKKKKKLVPLKPVVVEDDEDDF